MPKIDVALHLWYYFALTRNIRGYDGAIGCGPFAETVRQGVDIYSATPCFLIHARPRDPQVMFRDIRVNRQQVERHKTVVRVLRPQEF